MDAWYKGKLLERLGAAWPLSKLRPMDVEEVDTRTWLVLYRHVETAEETTVFLLKVTTQVPHATGKGVPAKTAAIAPSIERPCLRMVER
jgi:hypothetical protein